MNPRKLKSERKLKMFRLSLSLLVWNVYLSNT